MKNVQIIYEAIEPCNIEIRRVLKLLESKDLLVSRGLEASQVKKEDLLWCDVMLLVRSTSSIERDFAILAKRMRKFIILLIDDDFLSLGASYGADGSGYRTSRHKCLKTVLNHIDCLLTVNKLLADKYISYCQTQRYEVTNTIVEEKEMHPTSQDGTRKEKVKLAIYVNDGSQELFNEIMKPALRMLGQSYTNRVAIYLMALHPDMSEFDGVFDIHFVPHMPYNDFKQYLGTEGFDIGLAPLTDSGFSKYKYFNKYIEYTLAGIPAVYSDCPLYRLVIQDGYNGIFTDNSKEGWNNAMSRMIDNAELRRDLITNAQQHLYENFQAESILSKLIKDIPELINYKSPKNDLSLLSVRIAWIRLNYYFFRVSGWCGTVINMVKQGNFMKLWIKIKTRVFH